MATDLASTRTTARMKVLCDKIARTVQPPPKTRRVFLVAQTAPSALDWAIRAYETLAPTTDRRPRKPVLSVRSPGVSAVEPGLATIRGWAYSAEEEFPEGIVEASLDEGDDWVVDPEPRANGRKRRIRSHGITAATSTPH